MSKDLLYLVMECVSRVPHDAQLLQARYEATVRAVLVLRRDPFAPSRGRGLAKRGRCKFADP